MRFIWILINQLVFVSFPQYAGRSGKCIAAGNRWHAALRNTRLQLTYDKVRGYV